MARKFVTDNREGVIIVVAVGFSVCRTGAVLDFAFYNIAMFRCRL